MSPAGQAGYRRFTIMSSPRGPFSRSRGKFSRQGARKSPAPREDIGKRDSHRGISQRAKDHISLALKQRQSWQILHRSIRKTTLRKMVENVRNDTTLND